GAGLGRLSDPLDFRLQKVDDRCDLGFFSLGDQPANPFHHLLFPRQGLGGEKYDAPKHFPRKSQKRLHKPTILPGVEGKLPGDVPARFEIDQLLPILRPIQGTDEAVRPVADLKIDFSAVFISLPGLEAFMPGSPLALVHPFPFRAVQQGRHSLKQGGFPRFVRRFDQVDPLGKPEGLTHPPAETAKKDPRDLHPRTTSLLNRASSPLYKARFSKLCSSGSAVRMRSSILRTNTSTTPVSRRNCSKS